MTAGDIRYLLDLGLTVEEIAARAARTPLAITKTQNRAPAPTQPPAMGRRRHRRNVGSMNLDDCMHPGEHCKPNNCPDCGRFSAHSWDTGGFGTQNGWNQHWGGTCSKCGEWSESAA